MPSKTDSMFSGTISEWMKKIGEELKKGEHLLDIETDKATAEVESDRNGVLLHIIAKVGEVVDVDGPIAIIGKAGESFKHLLSGGGSAAPVEVVAAPVVVAAPAAAPVSGPAVSSNAFVFKMPSLSDSMMDGRVIEWVKKEGDSVEKGELLVVLASDKADMDVESPKSGVLLHIIVKDGESTQVDFPIAIIGNKGDAYQHLLAGGAPSAPVAKAVSSSPAPSAQVAVAAGQMPQPSPSGQRMHVTPVARVMAEEAKISLSQVIATGDEGRRIIKKDVLTAIAAGKNASNTTAVKSVGSAAPVGTGVDTYEDIKNTGIRNIIAKKLTESKANAPHFYLTIEVNMDKATEMRKQMNEVAAPVKISFNDFVVKSVAASLKQHPVINSSWGGDYIRRNNSVNIGVAVMAGDNLYVPVVRGADSKSFSQISTEVRALAGKAKDGKLTTEDMQGSTFSISNLGMYDVEEFTAIINPPNAGILAVGAIIQKPIVRDGAIVVGSMMKLTLSCDHRVIDGAMGAQFLQTLKKILENPVLLMV
jgi:pyruvate dehydrogenase E2 component (dihydrolipoamide acetyltransferase)